MPPQTKASAAPRQSASEACTGPLAPAILEISAPTASGPAHVMKPPGQPIGNTGPASLISDAGSNVPEHNTGELSGVRGWF